jgi:predicted dehydrogenase
MQCLAAGRNVITEKPMAVSTAQCDAMIAMARKKGVMLSTYHNRHWDGCIMQAGKTIRSGAIGDVVRIEGYMQGYGVADTWRGSKSATGGILFDWGVHFMEYMLQIAGAELAEVSGFASSGVHAKTSRWRRDTIEDEAMAVVRFRDGKWLTLCISNIDCNPKREWVEVTGTEGTYLFDYKEWQVITKADGVLTTAKGANPESQSRRYYSNVVAHLVKGTPLVITPEWARRPVHVLDLADRSAKSGRSLQARYK